MSKKKYTQIRKTLGLSPFYYELFATQYSNELADRHIYLVLNCMFLTNFIVNLLYYNRAGGRGLILL